MENLELVNGDDFYILPEGKEEIIRICKEKALNIFIERKDERYVRQKDDTSFDDLLKIFSESKMHWVFIKRKPQQNPIGHYVFQNERWVKYTTYYEIGGCTLNHKSNLDYFLFIYLTEEVGDKVVNEYKLKLS